MFFKRYKKTIIGQSQRRARSMVKRARFTVIERAIGHCRYYVEKKERILKQIHFLQRCINDIDKKITELEKPHVASMPSEYPSREDFLVFGAESLREKRDFLQRELEELQLLYERYSGYEAKLSSLEARTNDLLENTTLPRSRRIHGGYERYRKIDSSLQSISEDLACIDKAMAFLEKNIDYLKSCRNFLVFANCEFLIGAWSSEKLMVSLRHTSVGRAIEMANGADRNMVFAEMELMCAMGFASQIKIFISIVFGLLDSLFQDICIIGKIEKSIAVVDCALKTHTRILEGIKSRKNLAVEKYERMKKEREEAFLSLIFLQ